MEIFIVKWFSINLMDVFSLGSHLSKNVNQDIKHLHSWFNYLNWCKYERLFSKKRRHYLPFVCKFI